MDYSPKYRPARDPSYHELKRRVNSYFDQAHISRFANRAMRTKTLIIFLLYFVPYFFLLTGKPANPGVFFFQWGSFAGWIAD